jgi:hypothetical protein
VAKSSFASLKQQFDEVCTSLRAFTLGQRGVTQRAGGAAIGRMKELCSRLKRLFTSGPNAESASALANSGRCRVVAAETRLALLQGKR